MFVSPLTLVSPDGPVTFKDAVVEAFIVLIWVIIAGPTSEPLGAGTTEPPVANAMLVQDAPAVGSDPSHTGKTEIEPLKVFVSTVVAAVVTPIDLTMAERLGGRL
jgi:hypothetical protein